MRRLTLAAVLVTAAACTHERPIRFATGLDPAAPFHYHLDLDVSRLGNGLTVVYAPSAGTNLVAVDVRYEVGAADEPAGKSGLAHFVEHLTFVERPDPARPTLDEQLGAAALIHNAYTNYDETHYTATALAGRWPELLDVEATRMSSGCDAMDPALFERERAVVAEELDQRHSSRPDPIFAAVFGKDHPYGHSIGGTDLAAITRQDVCDFVSGYYAPDRAVLVISGAVDKPAMQAAVLARFGHIRRHATAARRKVAPLPELPGPAVQTVHADVDAPVEVFAWPAPAWGTNQALYQMVSELLIQGALADLDTDRKDVTGTDVEELGGFRGGATVVAVTLKPGTRPGEIDQAIQKKLDSVLEPGSGYWMGVLRAYLYDGLVERFEDLGSRGAMCADYVQYTDGTAFQIHDLGVVHAMTAPRLLSYADHYLVHDKPKIVHVLPIKGGAHPTSIAAAIRRSTRDLPASRLQVDDAEADRALPAPVPAAEVQTSVAMLDNGLRVVFAPRPGSALFEARLVFPTGTADDPPGRPGTAHLAAHGLDVDFHRSMTWAVASKVRAGYESGTTTGVSVGENDTTFWVHGLAAWGSWHLWRLHLRLEGGSYRAKDIAAAQRHDDDGDDSDVRRARRRRRLVNARLFGAHHPYASEAKDVTLSPDELQRFRDAHYVTEGATLIISGSFDHDAIWREVSELFGAWPRRAPRDVRQVPAPSPAAGPTVFADDHAEGPQVHVHVAFLVRSTFATAGPARIVAAELVNQRLAAIREEMAASYGVDASYGYTAAGDLIDVDGDVDGAQAGPVVARIVAELDRLRGHAAELRADFVRARRAALRDTLAREGSADDAATEVQALVTRGLPLDHFARLPAAVGKVTPDDVGKLLAGDLDPSRMVLIVSGPGAKAAAAAANLGPVHELPK